VSSTSCSTTVPTMAKDGRVARHTRTYGRAPEVQNSRRVVARFLRDFRNSNPEAPAKLKSSGFFFFSPAPAGTASAVNCERHDTHIIFASTTWSTININRRHHLQHSPVGEQQHIIRRDDHSKTITTMMDRLILPLRTVAVVIAILATSSHSFSPFKNGRLPAPKGLLIQPPTMTPTTTATTTHYNRRMATPPLHASLSASLVAANSTDFSFQQAETPTNTNWWNPSSRSTKSLTTTVRPKQSQQFKVFCDMDGVLVDFEHGIKHLFPDRPRHLPFSIQELHRADMWKRASTANSFFEHLPWMPGGKQLWRQIQHLQPDILTGVPVYRESRAEKFSWCQRELGLEQQPPLLQHVDMAGHWNDHSCVNGARWNEKACNVITCWSLNKYHESGPGAVLIDDRLSLKANWERKGGIFIHHNGDTDATLQQMSKHGILQ